MSSIKKLRRQKEKCVSPDGLRDILLDLGQGLLNEGHFEEALTEFQELSELAKDTDLEAFAHRKLGEIHEKLGNYEEAYKRFKTYEEVALSSPVEHQRALTTLGGHFLDKAQYMVFEEDSRFTMDSPEMEDLLLKAKKYSHRAEEAIKNILDPGISEKEEMRSAIYANQFKISTFRRNLKEADEFFRKAEQIMLSNKYNDRLICLYESRSAIHHRGGQLDYALGYIDKAIRVVSSEWILRKKALILVDSRSFLKAQHVLMEAYKSVSRSYREDFKTLLRSVFAILKILDKEEDCGDELRKMEDLGDICAGIEAYHAAIWYYDTAVNRCEADPQSRRDPRVLSGLLTSLAMTYKDLKKFDLASSFYERELSLPLGSLPEEKYKTLLALCVTCDLEGRSFESIRESYMAAQTLAQEMGDAKKELHCLNEFIQFCERRSEECPEGIRSHFEALLTDNGLSVEDIGPEVEEENEGDVLDRFDVADVEDIIVQIESSDKRSKRSKVNLKKDIKGETELHRKVKAHGNERDVARLIHQCVFVDIEDNALYTPLHEAANHGQLEYVQMLVSAGADINKVSDSGTSPLLSAAVNGHGDVMEFLLDRGAKAYHQDNDGGTALDYLVESGVDQEDPSYRRLHTRLSRAIETKVATGLRLEPKKGIGSSAVIVVCDENVEPEELPYPHENLKSMKVNEKITKYSERSDSVPHLRRSSDPLSKTASSSKATSEYRKTMAFLGSSGASLNAPTRSVKSKAEKIYSKSVISEKEYNFVNALDKEEWLEEDVAAPKRRKSLNWDAQPQSKKRRSFSSSDEDESPPMPEKRRSNDQRPSCNGTSTADQRSRPNVDQRSIVNHVTRPSSNGSSIVNHESRTSNASAINHIFRTNKASGNNHVSRASHQWSRPSRPLTEFFKPARGPPVTTLPPHPLIKDSALRVKVHVYEKVFLIPILNKNRSAEWLANEASKRYHSATGQRLLLQLTTQDGAEIYPKDPLNSIIASSMDHFVAVRTSLNGSIPLEKFYAKRCKELNRNMHKPLLLALTAAIKSGSFALPPKLPFDLSDLEPLLETLSYGLSGRLRELSIPYNHLSELNFQTTFFGLTGLRTLNLSQCGLLSHHFSENLPTLPSLEELDLSHNDIGDEALNFAHKTFPSVTKLNLKKCGLSKDFTLPSELCERIVALNVSGNSLSRGGIQRLLSSLNPSALKTLDISYCGSFDSIQSVLLELNSGGEELPLEHLNVSGLDLKSTVSEFRVFEQIPVLKRLVLSGNSSLPIPELERLLEGIYVRNILLEQFEATDLFSLYCYEDPSEYNKFVKVFERLLASRNLVCFRLHMDDEEDLLGPFIESLSSVWKRVHGDNSSVECRNQVLAFGHPIYS